MWDGWRREQAGRQPPPGQRYMRRKTCQEDSTPESGSHWVFPASTPHVHLHVSSRPLRSGSEEREVLPVDVVYVMLGSAKEWTSCSFKMNCWFVRVFADLFTSTGEEMRIYGSLFGFRTDNPRAQSLPSSPPPYTQGGIGLRKPFTQRTGGPRATAVTKSPSGLQLSAGSPLCLCWRWWNPRLPPALIRVHTGKGQPCLEAFHAESKPPHYELTWCYLGRDDISQTPPMGLSQRPAPSSLISAAPHWASGTGRYSSLYTWERQAQTGWVPCPHHMAHQCWTIEYETAITPMPASSLWRQLQLQKTLVSLIIFLQPHSTTCWFSHFRTVSPGAFNFLYLKRNTRCITHVRAIFPKKIKTSSS